MSEITPCCPLCWRESSSNIRDQFGVISLTAHPVRNAAAQKMRGALLERVANSNLGVHPGSKPSGQHRAPPVREPTACHDTIFISISTDNLRRIDKVINLRA
jgi:hypothetical protein